MAPALKEPGGSPAHGPKGFGLEAGASRHAVDEFNGTWKLIEEPRRSKDDHVRMVRMTHPYRHRCGLAGGPVNWTIGEWQVSHVYAILRRTEPAMYHACEYLRNCRAHGVRDLPLACAYEALARGRCGAEPACGRPALRGARGPGGTRNLGGG